jgi:hypothetical protein
MAPATSAAAARGRCRTTALLPALALLLLVTPLSTTSGARLWGPGGKAASIQAAKVTLEPQSVLQNGASQAGEAFESAFSETFSGAADSADVGTTLAQYDQMIQWLVTMPAQMYTSIEELHSFAIKVGVAWAPREGSRV